MAKPPVTVSPATNVSEVAQLMKEKGISSIVLITNGKPVGIVTERDLVHRVVASDKDPKKLTAADVFSKPVVAVSIHSPVEDAVATMKEHNISRLVVLNDKDQVAGILTTDDIGFNLKSMSEELAIEYITLTKRK